MARKIKGILGFGAILTIGFILVINGISYTMWQFWCIIGLVILVKMLSEE